MKKNELTLTPTLFQGHLDSVALNWMLQHEVHLEIGPSDAKEYKSINSNKD